MFSFFFKNIRGQIADLANRHQLHATAVAQLLQNMFFPATYRMVAFFFLVLQCRFTYGTGIICISYWNSGPATE